METLKIWGTLVNVFLVAGGGAVGTLLHALMGRAKKTEAQGASVWQNVSSTVMVGLGLCSVLIGIQGALQTKNILVVILSMALGAVLGTLPDLDGKVTALGNWVGKRIGGRGGNISEGFVSATLLFCVGAMAVTGSLEGGLLGKHDTLYAKAVIDMMAAAVLASTLGFGVILSAISVLLYQGSITMLATLVQPFLSEAVTTEMGAVGSLLVFGIGLNLMGITKLKLMNYVPAIFLPILLCLFM